MRKNFKRVTSCVLTTALIATSFFMMPAEKQEVQAAYTTGDAPYINTWLTAGPSDTSITDEIYGQAQPPVERPENGNWAQAADVSATSTWQTNAYDYPGTSPSEKNNVYKAIDGDKSTCWLSQMHDANADPEDWPEWDPAPAYYLDWKTPIKVKRELKRAAAEDLRLCADAYDRRCCGQRGEIL